MNFRMREHLGLKPKDQSTSSFDVSSTVVLLFNAEGNDRILMNQDDLVDLTIN